MSDTLTQTGVVQWVAGGRASVAVATGGCSSCGKQSACGVGKLAAGRPTTLIEIDTADHPGLRPGQQVSLELAADKVALGALLGYLLPALTLVLGAVIGQGANGSDVAAALGAGAGLALGILATRLLKPLLPTPRVTTAATPTLLKPLENSHG